MEFHRTAGLHGGDEPVAVPHLAMLGLPLQHLTLPGVLEGVLPGVSVPDGLVERIVAAVLQEERDTGGGRADGRGLDRADRRGQSRADRRVRGRASAGGSEAEAGRRAGRSQGARSGPGVGRGGRTRPRRCGPPPSPAEGPDGPRHPHEPRLGRDDQDAASAVRGSRHIGHMAGPPSGRLSTGPASSKPRRSYSLRLRALLASR